MRKKERKRQLKIVNCHPLAKLSVHIGPHLAVRPIDYFNFSMCTRHGASSNISCKSQYQNCVDAMNKDWPNHFIRFKAESHRMH